MLAVETRMTRILGHRGASQDAAENTLSAFRLALAQGADGVELDVQRAADGTLVVTHDESLQRLAGLPADVRRLDWNTLKRLDVASRLGFPAEGPPRLADVFEALPEPCFVNVELKCEDVDDRGLSLAVGAFLEARGLSPRVLVSSFNPLCLVRLAQRFPALRRGSLIDPDRALAWQEPWFRRIVRPAAIHPHFRQATDARIRRWKDEGLEVVVWTVDDVAEARRLVLAGADALITNCPGRLREALGL